MLKKLYAVTLVLMVALIAVLPVMAGMSGSGASGIQIQNLSTSADATVYVSLYNQTGVAPVSISGASGDTIGPKAAKNYYLPTIAGLLDGAYSMVASSTQPIAAIARTDWSTTGGAGLYSTVNPGTDVTIPLITGAYASQTSKFSIQNTNTTAAINDVTITLYGAGLAAPVVVKSGESIAAGTSKTYDLGDNVFWGTLPDTGTSAGLGASGFVGSVRITSATNLVVQSFIDVVGSRGVTAFVGVPTSAAATALYCPLIRANYYGDTGISLVNPGGSDVTATITFYPDAASPHTGTNYTQEINVPANSSAVAFQGPGGNSRQAPASLPGGTQSGSNPTPTNDGFFGVAKVEGTGALMAVVNDTKFGSGWSVQSQSTYNCVPASEGGTAFALPLIRKFHIASTKLTTGIQVQNLTNAEVTVALEVFSFDGTALPLANLSNLKVPANGSLNIWNGNLTNVPTVPASLGGYGWFGSGILTATGNVAVVVSDEGFGATAVDSANYNALLMPAP